MRISTQVYALVDDQRKPLDYVATDGTKHEMRVDVDLYECWTCHAIIFDVERHAAWHRVLERKNDE